MNNNTIGEQIVNLADFKRFAAITGKKEFSATFIAIAPRRTPGISELFSQETTTQLTVKFLRETTAVNSASPIELNTAFPEQGWTLVEVEAPVQRIGIFTKCTSELFEDQSNAANFFNARLGELTREREDAEILNGTGAAGHLQGVLSTPDIQTRTQAEPLIQTIAKAMTAVRVLGYSEPSAILMHPSDYEGLILTNGAADFGDVNAQTFFSKPVLLTMALSPGTALVGDFVKGGAIRRKAGFELQMTNSNENDFQYNRMAIRLQSRLALCIFRPAAFCEITGSGAGGLFQ